VEVNIQAETSITPAPPPVAAHQLDLLRTRSAVSSSPRRWGKASSSPPPQAAGQGCGEQSGAAVERPKYRMTAAIKKLLDDDGITVSSYEFQQAWKLNDLKNPAKGFAIQLGGQWFWYQEGIDKIREIVTAG
jgi:hypothetical protein